MDMELRGLDDRERWAVRLLRRGFAETCVLSPLPQRIQDWRSHPARVRGLKRLMGIGLGMDTTSHLARVRGLKLSPCPLRLNDPPVAPRAGP